jgi:hypothetical protein
VRCSRPLEALDEDGAGAVELDAGPHAESRFWHNAGLPGLVALPPYGAAQWEMYSSKVTRPVLLAGVRWSPRL